MTQRHFTEGYEILFITTVTRHRCPYFAHHAFAREAVELLYRVQNLHPFDLYGFVIMPDHVHFLMRAPTYPIHRIIGAYKSGLTFDIGISPLWQRRYFMKVPTNAARVLQYIHMNPVKAGLSSSPEKYPWSSASRKWDVSPLEY